MTAETKRRDPRRLVDRGGFEAQLLRAIMTDEADVRAERRAWDRFKQRRLSDLLLQVLGWMVGAVAVATAVAWLLSRSAPAMTPEPGPELPESLSTYESACGDIGGYGHCAGRTPATQRFHGATVQRRDGKVVR